jgi:hypothetical protein
MFAEIGTFLTANPEVIALMIAGGVIGVVTYGVRKVIKAGR